VAAVRVAVVSDIHGNLPALEAVLEEIDGEGIDELWCLGDVVGYAAQPNECCAAIGERAAVCLAGNHDLAVRGTIDLAEFSGDAGVAAAWTRQVLDDASRAFLDRLEPVGEREHVGLFHGSPVDPVWEYVLSEEAVEGSFELAPQALLLVGHSHVPLAVRDDLTGGLAPAGTEKRLDGARWLLNPGSVGQPRDGDPRAAWLLLDLEARFAAFRRVAYPIERTQAVIREQGLPPLLAERLARGE
jgi:predicted phosphodiesterase